MAWTNVPKPTTSTWISNNPVGKEQYDQANLSYDDSNVFYDGTNPMQWTDVAKPTNGRTIYAGMATGLLMPLTYSREYDASSWVKVSKPN